MQGDKDFSQGFRLGEWTVQPERNRIRSDVAARSLEGKVMAVLVHVARKPGKVVTKSELLDSVWPNQDVADGVLTRAVYELRRALDDDAGRPRYIENIPRVGYRLLQQPAKLDESHRGAASRTRGQLKSMSAAMVVLLVGLLAYQFFFGNAEPLPIVSVAVLPFANMTGDEGKDYICDGLAEEVIHTIAQQPSLAVSARTSSFALRDQGLTAEDIGRRLSVDGIIEGSVRQERGLQRITAQLIDVRTGSHRGSITFDIVDGNLFAAQARISERIIHLLAQAGASIRSGHDTIPAATDIQAYDLYLRGRAALQTRSADSLREAREFLLEAIRVDPDFAPAHASLAQLYLVSRAYLQLGVVETRELAEAAVAQALALDPKNVEALVVSAALTADSGDFESSLEQFSRAIELQPSFALAHLWRGEVLHTLGYAHAALESIEKALRLDPLAGSTNTVMAKAAAYFADDERLFSAADRAESFDARHAPRLLMLHHYRRQDLYSFATELRRYHDVVGIEPAATNLIIRAFAGEIERSSLADRLVPYGLPRNNFFARELAMLGLHSAAMDALLRWPRNEGSFIADIWLPEFRGVRALPEFPKLIRQLGLDDYWRIHGLPDACARGTPEPFCRFFTTGTNT